ncbi:YdcF family protein [Planktothrix mougeotii]|uniref:YdcF family protein n=1 Tax=Planktothrix mougeotii LEGE 06226 TaxID=1828728 RepID=A0ABR9UH77_9CYAN|nr:YdcF family protein [Planktothrix mougeotii]MBE9145822.1 YdcF family protein [Planktothrix mougeotii LEGE 06226]
MFLFLSKLLPLFIYPLGLSCLLMFFALFTLWKYPRWTGAVIGCALVILLLGSSRGVAQGLVRSLESQNVPQGELPNAAAIIVLGGGTKPALSPRPWVDVGEAGDRILYGALLYRQKKAPWLILSGGRINWQGGGDPESQDMAKIAEVMGVPPSAILQDPTSLNTYENAVNVRKILEEKNIKDPVLLVTSALHTPRSLLIFKRQGINVIPAPTDFLMIPSEINEAQKTWQGILLSWIPDTLSLHQTTQALKEYIGLGVYRWRGWL